MLFYNHSSKSVVSLSQICALVILVVDKQPNKKSFRKEDAMEEKKERGFTRRAILKNAAGMAVAGAALSPIKTGAGEQKKRRLGMVIDLRKCTGCGACSVACKEMWDVPTGKWRSWVKVVEKGEFPNVKTLFLRRLCMQCDNAPCLRNCPTKATFNDPDTGIVRIDPDKCITCKYCLWNCPYGARFINPQKQLADGTVGPRADKCDFCYPKVMRGENPACVDACPYGAITFGDLDDPESEVSRLIKTEKVTRMKPELGTEPKVYYIGWDDALLDAKVDSENEEERRNVA